MNKFYIIFFGIVSTITSSVFFWLYIQEKNKLKNKLKEQEELTNKIIDKNISERSKFYLGNLFYDDDNSIELNDTFISKEQLDKKDKVYNKPLYNIINKSKHKNKKFKWAFGDIQSTNTKETLAKNRVKDSGNNSVILRSMEFNRHWGNIYKPPIDNIPFFDKKIPKVFWRGTTTGSEDRPGNRFDLIKRWFNRDDSIDVGLSFVCQDKDNYKKYIKGSVDLEEMLAYKYILSVEGNDKDSGINWKLNSKSLVMMPKPTVTSWLMETTLIPGYHYVLLKDDFSDLKEKFLWCENNQDKCKEIIMNANIYMDKFKINNVEQHIEKEVLNIYFSKLKQEV